MRWLLFLVTVAGCGTPRWALVGGKRVERPSFGYTDNDLFAVNHERAYPNVFEAARSLWIDDGVLEGRACNLSVLFYSEWYGPRLTLLGRAQVPWSPTIGTSEGAGLSLWIKELGPGHRRITGSPTGAYTFPIDLDVSADRIVGEVGRRKIDLTAGPNHFLVGRMIQHDTPYIDEPFVVYGREMLRSMVPADEALILVMMLTCNGTIAYDGRWVRGFSLVPIDPQLTRAAPR